MTRQCAVCGLTFEARRHSARFCGDACRQRHHRADPVPADTRDPGEPGPIEAGVRADLGALITAHPVSASLAEMSYLLARTLDDRGTALAAGVTRELRANLAEIRRSQDFFGEAVTDD